MVVTRKKLPKHFIHESLKIGKKTLHFYYDPETYAGYCYENKLQKPFCGFKTTKKHKFKDIVYNEVIRQNIILNSKEKDSL